jgi:hypothetical protein
MRQSDHGPLGDGRVFMQDLLNLAWIHVVAAPDDQVFLSVDDVVIAFLAHPGHVGGVDADGMAARVCGSLGSLRGCRVSGQDHTVRHCGLAAL